MGLASVIKRGLVPAALAVVLAIPALVAAGPGAPREFGGRVEADPRHHIFFDVQGSGDNRKLRNFFLIGVPIACTGESDVVRETGPIDGRVPVNGKGRFRKTIAIPDGGNFKFKVAGKFKSNTKVRGTYSLEFDGMDKELGHCYTGNFSWRAAKPAPIVLPRGGGEW